MSGSTGTAAHAAQVFEFTFSDTKRRPRPQRSPQGARGRVTCGAGPEPHPRSRSRPHRAPQRARHPAAQPTWPWAPLPAAACSQSLRPPRPGGGASRKGAATLLLLLCGTGSAGLTGQDPGGGRGRGGAGESSCPPLLAEPAPPAPPTALGGTEGAGLREPARPSRRRRAFPGAPRGGLYTIIMAAAASAADGRSPRCRRRGRAAEQPRGVGRGGAGRGGGGAGRWLWAGGGAAGPRGLSGAGPGQPRSLPPSLPPSVPPAALFLSAPAGAAEPGMESEELPRGCGGEGGSPAAGRPPEGEERPEPPDTSVSNGGDAAGGRELVELRVIWNKNKYDVKFCLDSTGAELKQKIHSLTGVWAPARPCPPPHCPRP